MEIVAEEFFEGNDEAHRSSGKQIDHSRRRVIVGISEDNSEECVAEFVGSTLKCIKTNPLPDAEIKALNAF